MRTFESSQKDESRAQSADSSKAYRKRRGFYCHKYNNNLARVQFESRKAVYIFLRIMLGANKNKLPKGNRKDSGK